MTRPAGCSEKRKNRPVTPTRNISDTSLMGDMNYDLLDIDSLSEDLFKDEMFSYSYSPIINHPTRITDDSATCIDHIWTNTKDCQITSGIFTD